MTRRVVATFEREDLLLAAVTHAREQGYPVAEVYSPYPVHGLDEAIGHRPTRLGVVCFLFGLFGVLLAMGFQYWTHSVDWRVNVGGRPFNAWPAYVPVAFEVMVLLSGVGTVLVFLAVSRLFPGKKVVMPAPRVTDDRFVVVVEGREEAVDLAGVQEFFRANGAVAVEEGEDRPSGTCPGIGARALTGILALLLACCAVGIWTLVGEPTRFNDALIRDMASPVSYPGDAAHPDLPGGMVRQAPQEGTIARGAMPLLYGATAEEAGGAGRELVSPYATADAAVLERGARVFSNFCVVCHGPEGKGDGPVTRRGVPPPPSLLDPKGFPLTAGRIFHIVTYGQGNMPTHAAQIPPEDRWAVAAYILQFSPRK